MALENIGNGCSISAELLHVIVKCTHARHFQTHSRYLKMALDHHNRKQAVVAEEAMCVPDNLFLSAELITHDTDLPIEEMKHF